MSAHFPRALMLFEQSRYELAEQELRRSLLAEPDNARAHALLALCLSEREQHDEATREAEAAIHHAPDVPFTHYALARVYSARDREEDARAAIDEAIRLDPEDAGYYALKAAIHLDLRDWSAALDAAVEGLQVDPEHVGCANLRAMALVKLGRKAEAQTLLDETLAKAPENDVAHANKGWTLLHQGRPREAMEHFREALRLDPENPWARHGMIEALKARHLVYRVMLAYFLWMSGLNRKAQWGVIIGLYVVPRILRGVARTNPGLRTWLLPIVGVFILFALMTWIADPLFNLLLRLSRFGRYALSRTQRMASNALLACLVGGVASLVVGAVTGHERFYIATFAFLIMMIPVSGTFAMRPGWPRKMLTAYTIVLVLLAGVVVTIGLPSDEGEKTAMDRISMACVILWLVGIFAFGWIANGLAMARVRK